MSDSIIHLKLREKSSTDGHVSNLSPRNREKKRQVCVCVKKIKGKDKLFKGVTSLIILEI